MSPERQIYLLDPQHLPPETIAVTFAKTSRSPLSFREIADELTDEKSAEFNEKWVVGYGHASVAEHAVLHIAVENISRLAVECLESNRLASYTEKSTRYQKWGMDDFFIPEEIHGSPLLEDYLKTIRLLLETYHRALPEVKKVIAGDHPIHPGESESAWERRIRSDYVDVCRYLLPAACLANVGMTINARALEHALVKMLSHPLAEVRSVGQEIKQAAREVIPTLVKYAEPSSYLSTIYHDFPSRSATPSNPANQADWCVCHSLDKDIENRLLAAFLLPTSDIGYAQILEWVQGLSQQDRTALVKSALGSLGKFDIPLRELEHCSFTVEVVLDQGAFFELKRHRMMTQSVQQFTPWLGYAVPSAITRAGLEPSFRLAMESAGQMYKLLAAINPQVASYVLPNAYNRRVLLTMNLRSAMHLVQLRSASNAHFAMRRVAQKMAEMLRSELPLFGPYIKTAEEETWQGIEAAFFTQTH